MVGDNKLSLLGVRDVDVLFVGIVFDGTTGAVRVSEADMPSLVIAEPVEGKVGFTIGGGDVLM